MKFTFDGHGINDADNEYKPRIATLQPYYKTSKVGNLLAAAPDLLASLQFLTDAAETEPGMEIYRAHIEQAREAIKRATL